MDQSVADAIEHIEYASQLNLPVLELKRPRPGKCILVGAGLSAHEYRDDIYNIRFGALPKYMIALNWMHTWLIKQCIVPQACVFFEVDADPTEVLKQLHPDVTYYVCSHCHPRTFEALKGYNVVLWHAKTDFEEILKIQCKYFPHQLLLSGGATTLIRSIDIGRVLGYRDFDLFGCDSSFPENGVSHIPGYPLDNHTGLLERIKLRPGAQDQRTFWTYPYLALQAEQFRAWCKANHSTFLMRVHGDGMLRYIHEQDWPEMYDIGW